MLGDEAPGGADAVQHGHVQVEQDRVGLMLGHQVQRLLEGNPGADVGAGELERGERGVPLVEVDQARLDPEFAKHQLLLFLREVFIATSALRIGLRGIARDRLMIAVVGAIDEKDAAALVDKAFADLPAKGHLKPVPDAAFAGLGAIDLDQRRQPLRRLVEHEEPRVEDERASDRQHLLLTTG